MRRLVLTAFLVMGLAAASRADIWRWVDMNGRDHYVTTNKPIYTWLDDHGDVHFSDKPDHPNAVRARLIWHSAGTLADQPASQAAADAEHPDESPEERAERLAAEAYYCRQATDIYETYRSAPQLYQTKDNGERYYLSAVEMAAAIAEAESNMALFCG